MMTPDIWAFRIRKGLEAYCRTCVIEGPSGDDLTRR